MFSGGTGVRGCLGRAEGRNMRKSSSLTSISSSSQGSLAWHDCIDSIIPYNVILCICVIATNRVERHTKINDLKVNMDEWASMNSRREVLFYIVKSIVCRTMS